MSTPPSASVPPIDISALVAEFDASGMSAAAFARSRGVGTWRLYHALQRRSGKLGMRRSASRAGPPALLPVRVVDPRPARSPAPLELVLAGGHRLLIGADFDGVLLRRLLGALAQC
jgi:hypothetical protein